MAHAFISYKHDDFAFAEDLLKRLEHARIAVWLDAKELRAGEDWRREIDDGILNAFALIVVMSPEARQSEYVTYEWAYALGAGVPVIPLLIRDTILHPRLDALQYLDFRQPYSLQWGKLVALLNELAQESPATRLQAQQDATPWLEALQSRDANARAAAAAALGKAKYHQAVEPLNKVLRDDRDVQVQVAAARALGELGDPRAVSALAKALNASNDLLIETAAHALGKIGSPALSALIERLPTSSSLWYSVSKSELAAIQSLGMIDDPLVTPKLIDMLRVGNDNVRSAVLRALRGRGGEAVVLDVLNALAQTTDSYGSYERYGNLIWVLGELGDVRAVPTLVRLLEKNADGRALSALEKFGTDEAKLAIRRHYRKKRYRLYRKIAFSAFWIGWASVLALAYAKDSVAGIVAVSLASCFVVLFIWLD